MSLFSWFSEGGKEQGWDQLTEEAEILVRLEPVVISLFMVINKYETCSD
jgi:hypothetical protein